MTNTQATIYAAIWNDKMLGPLSLNAPDAESAKRLARDIHARGAGKVDSVRAVRHVAGSKVLDTLENLSELESLSDGVIHYMAPMACGGAERAEATRRYNIRTLTRESP